MFSCEQLKYTEKLTNAVKKLAKANVGMNFFKFVQLDESIFYAYKDSNIKKLQPAQIVANASSRVDDYAFGFIIRKYTDSIDVCFCDADKPDNILTYHSDRRRLRADNGRILFVSDMLVDEFVCFINKQLKKFRNLDKRAKITNRDYLEMKKEIKELKKIVYELKKKSDEDEEGRELSKQIISQLEFAPRTSARQQGIRTYNNKTGLMEDIKWP